MVAASSNREAKPTNFLKIGRRLEQGYLYISLHGKLMLHMGRDCSHTSCECYSEAIGRGKQESNRCSMLVKS